MFDINKARTQSESFSLRQIEQSIDDKIDFASEQGRFVTAFVLDKHNAQKYENYKEVIRKYTKEGYEVSYGRNHDGNYLISISWREK